jgi:hypothetical protein
MQTGVGLCIGVCSLRSPAVSGGGVPVVSGFDTFYVATADGLGWELLYVATSDGLGYEPLYVASEEEEFAALDGELFAAANGELFAAGAA